MAGESRGNHFVNDGSFMEMFRRLQEQQNQSSNQPVDENAQMEGSRSKLPCNTSGGASMVTRDTARESKGTIPRTTQLVETRNDKKKVEDDEKTGIADLPPLAKASQVAEYNKLLHVLGLTARIFCSVVWYAVCEPYSSFSTGSNVGETKGTNENY